MPKTPYDEKDHARFLLPILLGMFGERVQRTERADSLPNHSGRGKKTLPAELEAGEAKFNTFCSRCHGAQGQGTNNGPPLVHKIYEPNHHADMAFQRAAAQGVRAHHWKFGNMPKIDGVVPDDVTQIIGYIRWLQRQAGIS